MTTTEIINDLRANVTVSMSEAADRLEELLQIAREKSQERDEALEEVYRLKVELAVQRIKVELATNQSNLQSKNVRPEPSRLEIAAMFSTTEWCDDATTALQFADELIAAARETK